MEKLHPYDNVGTVMHFMNNSGDSEESKLAFETAIGDMENESSIEWSDEFLPDYLD